MTGALWVKQLSSQLLSLGPITQVTNDDVLDVCLLTHNLYCFSTKNKMYTLVLVLTNHNVYCRDPPNGMEPHIPVIFLDLNGKSRLLTANL